MTIDDPKAIATGISIGELVLKALGLDGGHVTGVTLSVGANEAVAVSVTRYITNEQGEAIFGELTTDKYTLVKREA